MKVLHCSLADIYADNFGYQINIMTKMHKLQGHDVRILASIENYDENKALKFTEPSRYLNSDGVQVVRIPYVEWLPISISRKVRIYKGVRRELQEYGPDVIFMHNFHTEAVYPIISYIKKHPNIRLFIDSHVDSINSAKSWISKNILHRILYKNYIKHTFPYVTKFYGTLPRRRDFLIDFYGTPFDRTEYLPMGVDDISIIMDSRSQIRSEVRNSLNIQNDDFVIITGGKIDPLKNTDKLINAFIKLKEPYCKLVIFGSISDSMKEKIQSLMDSDKRIIYVGWIVAKDTYRYLFASDLACFPGTHSVLWEEVVGLGIPAIFKEWEGITHVDRCGNCILLNDVTIDSLCSVMHSLISNKEKYLKMKENAESKDATSYFSYYDISKRAIQ